MFESYCKLHGTTILAERQNVSFSLWEELPGINRTIFADPTIPNKFHVFSKRNLPNDYHVSYVTISTVESIKVHCGKILPELESSKNTLIELYERVRSHANFNSNNCPILEVQTVGLTHYFLQYHPARNRTPTTHKVVISDNGLHNAAYVVGATPPEGITVRTIMRYPIGVTDHFLKDQITKGEDASFDCHFNSTFAEIMFPQRKVQFDVASGGLQYTFMKKGCDHDSVSLMSKPPVTVILNSETWRWLKDHPNARGNWLNGELQTLDIHVVADGERAKIGVVTV
jgi:hypothetical protein